MPSLFRLSWSLWMFHTWPWLYHFIVMHNATSMDFFYFFSEEANEACWYLDQPAVKQPQPAVQPQFGLTWTWLCVCPAAFNVAKQTNLQQVTFMDSVQCRHACWMCCPWSSYSRVSRHQGGEKRQLLSRMWICQQVGSDLSRVFCLLTRPQGTTMCITRQTHEDNPSCHSGNMKCQSRTRAMWKNTAFIY